MKNMPQNDPKFQVVYPPNGFIPVESFSMLVAPIAYVFSDPVFLYFMWREMFMSHFVKLFIISSDPECIVGLCALFESVLQSKDLQLFVHLRKIDCQPLRIVFKWIIRAFSGYLLSSQLLDLWDRIIAYNSLQILPSKIIKIWQVFLTSELFLGCKVRVMQNMRFFFSHFYFLFRRPII